MNALRRLHHPSYENKARGLVFVKRELDFTYFLRIGTATERGKFIRTEAYLYQDRMFPLKYTVTHRRVLLSGRTCNLE